MNKIKGLQNILSTLSIAAMMIVASSCIGDSSVAKKRGIVKDFSVIEGNENGCGKDYLVYETPYDKCTNICSSGSATEPGFHLASTTELATVKQDLVADTNTDLLTIVNGSANICVPDITVETRPTNAINIESDFCSCINGKSDIINNCDAFCANKTPSDQPILYVNTTVDAAIGLNTNLRNLYNWCTVQLPNDETNPKCYVSATDGTNTFSLPANVTAGSNSFNVNVLSLAKNRTWILKLVETQTGSNAQSKEFQIRRKDQVSDTTVVTGALKVAPINQYTCMTYGGKVDPAGNIIRTTFARIFYYFAANETPTPIAPAGGSNQSQVVCHDEQLHPGTDSAEYDRLELIPLAFAMWDKSDTRFVAKAENGGKLTINKMLEDELASSEYNIPGTTIDLFRLLSYPNRPTTATTASANIPLGYIMIPFTDSTTQKTYCPNSTHFTGNQPLLNILGKYMDDTEGIYLAEKEGETVLDGSSYKTLYGTMFVRESTLKTYGFYIENGLKIRADSNSMNSKMTYFYWPVNPTADPLASGGRKLFTVRTPSTLNGNVPTGQATNEATTDKRIGCIPKS
jgi:hypothetical protein